MFIANRIVPQHKPFLDEHSYEFREYPENDFERRVAECNQIRGVPQQPVEVVDTPGVLTPEIHEILYEIENHRMTLSYKMLLLMYMAELADREGCVSLKQIAERFQSFFVDRAARKKEGENPKRRPTRNALFENFEQLGTNYSRAAGSLPHRTIRY